MILSGLAQCAELSRQMIDSAENQQAKGAKLVLQHNVGLDGAVVMPSYRLEFPQHGARYICIMILLAKPLAVD